MRNLLLVTVTKVETLTVIDLFLKFTGRERKGKKIGNNIYYPLGSIGDVNILLVPSEMGAIGPGAAIITIKDAIKAFSPVAVIMVGIAFGADSKKQKKGEILVSRQIFSYEPQKVKEGGPRYRGDKVTVPTSLLKIFRSGDISWQGVKIHFGTILSGEKLINDVDFRDNLLAEEPEAIGGEMEGAGLYSAASDEKVDWILVKGICDFADGNKQDDAQFTAASNAASFVLHVIQQGYFDEDSDQIDNKQHRPPIDFPHSLYNIAKREIEKKKNQVPEMRPGFNLGEMKEFLKIGPSKNGTTGIIQYFDNGAIIFHADGPRAGETFATYGSINFRYEHMGEKPWSIIGLPISDECEAAWSPYKDDKGEPNKGRYSSFENGEIVWWATGSFQEQSYVILNPICKTYDSIGGSGSYLGFPISNSYESGNIERCDFEGGSIIHFKERGIVSIVHNLLRINYADSPFNHDWVKYAGPEDDECLKVRIDTRIGFGKNMVALNVSHAGRAVFFPQEKLSEIKERFIGVTIKSLNPDAWIRLYLRLKTSIDHPQYLELDSHNANWGLKEKDEEGVDYWQIPMPPQCKNSEWHTLVIDLEKTVMETYQSNYEIFERIYCRGHIGIGDIIVSNSREAIEAVAINPILIE